MKSPSDENNQGKIKIAVGIPWNMNMTYARFFDAWNMLEKPKGLEVIRAIMGPLHDMRNSMVMTAMNLGASHLLMVDADMVFPLDLINRLIAHDLPIVGALTFSRWYPHGPIMYQKAEDESLEAVIDYPKDQLFRVEATGTGCLLMNMEVFTIIDYPWFMFSYDEKSGKTKGEDLHFCQKAREAGFSIHVDTATKTGHITEIEIGEDHWLAARKAEGH